MIKGGVSFSKPHPIAPPQVRVVYNQSRTEERKIKMISWRHEINIGVPYDDQSGLFTEYRDQVVKILKESAWLKDSRYSWTLADYVHDLTIVDDVDRFDTVMDGVRNLANADGCWIHGPGEAGIGSEL